MLQNIDKTFYPSLLPTGKDKTYIAVSKKGRTYPKQYSVFLIKISEKKIVYESHILSFHTLQDAIIFRSYISNLSQKNPELILFYL